jgi:hypothetical protein
MSDSCADCDALRKVVEEQRKFIEERAILQDGDLVHSVVCRQCGTVCISNSHTEADTRVRSHVAAFPSHQVYTDTIGFTKGMH